MIEFEGWDHGNGGPWICSLSLPKGWRKVFRGKTRDGDKCMVLIVPKRRLKHGKTHKIPGRWEAVKSKNQEVPVSSFRAVIRKDYG